jgi:hypothetical protein
MKKAGRRRLGDIKDKELGREALRAARVCEVQFRGRGPAVEVCKEGAMILFERLTKIVTRRMR